MPIGHPAWVAARDALLAMAGEPGAVALLGPPGTGKSMLLRDVADQLRAGGRAVTLVRQGDLAGDVAPGAVLLVDEAHRAGSLERHGWLAQRRGFVVLADVDPPADDATLRTVALRPLTESETADFAAAWLQQNEADPLVLSDALIARLHHHAGGTVRLITQLLGAVHAVRDELGAEGVSDADIDHAAAMREGWRLPAAVAPDGALAPADPVPSGRPPIRRLRFARTAVAAGALAACVALAFGLRGSGDAPPLPPVATLPPLQGAELATPPLAASPAVQLAAELPAPPLAGTPALPPDVRAPEPIELAAGGLPAALGSVAPPALAGRTAPAVVAFAPLPRLATPANPAQIAATVATLIPPARPVRTGRRMGGAGMILVAQRGDTLERLYHDLYRDRAAPPYSVVAATNPAPIKPGAIVVFPEPPGGWGMVQR